MQAWRRRVLMFKLMGGLPFSRNVMDLLRHRLAGLGDYDFSKRIYIGKDFASLLSGEIFPLQGSSLVEIGSGWHPLLPILLHGLGAERVVMTDVARHMRADYANQAVEYLRRDGEDLISGFSVDQERFKTRIEALAGGADGIFDRFRNAGMEYLSPLDFRDTGFKDGEFDCVFSNSCLGYVPFPLLAGIFTEAARIVRPDGFFVNNIHVYDDFCRDGSEITPVNFLRFSEHEWNRVGNSGIHHQSRLRPRDYVKIASEAGFEILREDRVFEQLPDFNPSEVELHADFQGLPDEEIRCRNLFLVGRRATSETTLSNV